MIDDDPLQLRLVEAHLKIPDAMLRTKRVMTFSDPAEALAHMPADGVTAILCDYDMPDGSGVDWLPDLIKADVGPVLLFTATGNEQVAAQAFRLGVSDYLLKEEMMPDPVRLRHAVADAVRRYKMQKRNRLASHELKLANISLKGRNARLREMTDTAHQFVDNVAHEFRTPLTVIQEFASILEDGIGGPVTDEQKEYLAYIRSGVRDLSTLVDDFLDTSKLRARTLRVDRNETQAADLFERVRPTAEARAQSRSITVTFDAQPGLPALFCDVEKACRVIVNLVVNAVKFSPEGSAIEVTARAVGDGDVSIAVRDHGVGILAEDLPGLCERFCQADSPKRDSAKGFGLGLNIARDLVWLNLGAMSIQSKHGEGSTFSFTLPIAEPAHIVSRYARRLEQVDIHAQVSVMRLTSVHPGTTAEAIRAALAGSCQSLDLLLCGTDGQTLIALGPTEEADRWAERLRDAWAISGPKGLVNAPLQVAWLGSWPIDKIAERIQPVVVYELQQERRVA